MNEAAKEQVDQDIPRRDFQALNSDLSTLVGLACEVKDLAYDKVDGLMGSIPQDVCETKEPPVGSSVLDSSMDHLQRLRNELMDIRRVLERL